jgi:SAM-dependent methyltransferase
MARFLLAVLLAFSLTASALEDVPFVTTPDTVTRAMLDLAKVGRGDFVIDLGSGDGRIVIEAAKRYGARGLGVEIVPDLVRTSRENAKRAGVEKQAEFREQDLFQTDLAAATVITLYLLPDVNLQLRPRLLDLRPGTRVVSHDWDMAEWKPDRTITLDVPDKAIGFEKKSRVHLWVVPARLQGTWCATGNARGMRIVVQQSFQDVRGEFFDGTASYPFEGRIDGDSLRGISTAAARFDLKAERRRLIMQRAGNPLSRPPAVAFVPPARDGCR